MKWEVDELILLRLISLESLQIYYKNGRSLKDLNFLDCLLVRFASVAKPLILVAQLLRYHKLPETVIYSNFIILIVHHRVDFSDLIRIDLFELLEPD